MTKPTILMPSRMMPLVVERLAARFHLVRLWEEADREAWLAAHGGSVRGIAAGAHHRIDDAFMGRLPHLEIVASFGVGYDHVDAHAAARRGVVVTNTPDVLTEEVADLTLGLLLATVRRLPQAERYLREGRWKAQGSFPLSPTLRTRTIGILGYGRIGKAIARRLDAFGVTVVYHGRRRQEGVPHRHYDSLVEMARAVDTLICVAPGGAGTRHLVSTQVLEALGPDGVLINVGRGSVVDEAALIAALDKGTILTAGLDVFEDEPNVPAALLARDDVVLLPHVGSASVHTREAMGALVVDNLVSWFEGAGPLTPVEETPWRGEGAASG
ncbi:2-hydroxyacid dehydrogenase [Salinarimonas ramus]|uniref:Glycerate dehydrogenase n=1 Tax=Salinarimonas ramus TaxID=690164 RepID=A0A917QIM8_9HYPH|nr:2-hydroxyacid dehydrogenase [Salinarimonas ramus]GGK52422.1 glycerate dehydrogenase [Salinarimonas ramus]